MWQCACDRMITRVLSHSNHPMHVRITSHPTQSMSTHVYDGYDKSKTWDATLYRFPNGVTLSHTKMLIESELLCIHVTNVFFLS